MKIPSSFSRIVGSSLWLSAIACLTACSSLMQADQSTATLVPATPIIDKPLHAKTDAAPSHVQFLAAQGEDIRKAYQQYQATGHAPIISTESFLSFPFGQSQPIVNCQPLRACDITLEPGEKITGVYPGDSARWRYVAATSGVGASAEPHLIFKPTEDNLATNVVITTSRRTYYLALISKPNDYVRQVKFWYPEDLQAQWNDVAQATQAKAQAEQDDKVSTLPSLDAAHLDFNYRVDRPLFGSGPRWTPLRAFNDGTHVYLQMPASIRTTDAPALFVVSPAGQKQLVNYRVRAGYYIVDLLFKQAVLVSGTGMTQQRVTITYRG